MVKTEVGASLERPLTTPETQGALAVRRPRILRRGEHPDDRAVDVVTITSERRVPASQCVRNAAGVAARRDERRVPGRWVQRVDTLHDAEDCWDLGHDALCVECDALDD